MSFGSMLYNLIIGPLELLFDGSARYHVHGYYQCCEQGEQYDVKEEY